MGRRSARSAEFPWGRVTVERRPIPAIKLIDSQVGRRYQSTSREPDDEGGTGVALPSVPTAVLSVDSMPGGLAAWWLRLQVERHAWVLIGRTAA